MSYRLTESARIGVMIEPGADSEAFDDTFRWTFCPHDAFEMRAAVTRGDGKELVCTSVAELMDFLEGRGAQVHAAESHEA